MNLIKRILLPCFSVFILVLLVLNRMVPTGDLWKGYTVLYVPADSDEAVINQAFEKNDVKGVVSLFGQKNFLPFVPDMNSPEGSLSFISAKDSVSQEYLDRRNNYFFDKSGEYKVYYIPSEHKKKIRSCMAFLSKNHIDGGIDSKASYPWILPVICLFVFAFLLYFARNRVLYAATSVFPMFYIFTNPFYPSATGTLFSLLLIFCCTNVWKREGAWKILRKNSILLVFALMAFAAAFSSSLLSGLYFILSVFAAISFVVFYNEMEELFLNRRAFRFTYIRPAKMISIFSGKMKLIFTSMLIFQFLILISFFASSSQFVSNHFSRILLPAANASVFEQDASLPKLDEYYRWNWRIFTYPYVSLNPKQNAGNTENEVVYPRYQEMDGKIQRSEYHLHYDESFIEKVNENIDLLQFDSIEKVLKNQQKDLCPGFSSVKSNQTNIFGIIMMFASILLLLFIYFFIIIRATKTGGRK